MAADNPYLRFLNLRNALQAESATQKLDAIEANLLYLVMLAYSQSREILVGELIEHHELGSQATLHRRLSRLRQMGYVHLEPLPDGRKKRALPSKVALTYYDQLSSLLIIACHG